MRKKIDESSKPPRSDRLRGWWFRGVDTELPPQREELSNAMRTHLDGMASHARDIERAAYGDGARIRREALASASTIVSHVEHLESQLALIENQYGRVIDTMRTELADLRDQARRGGRGRRGRRRRAAPGAGPGVRSRRAADERQRARERPHPAPQPLPVA